MWWGELFFYISQISKKNEILVKIGRGEQVLCVICSHLEIMGCTGFNGLLHYCDDTIFLRNVKELL